jgi:hypothetical protein
MRAFSRHKRNADLHVPDAWMWQRKAMMRTQMPSTGTGADSGR